MNLFKLLNANNYLSINRPLAHEIGLDAAIFFSEVIDKYEYFQKVGGLVSFNGAGDDWFYLTTESVRERTTLGRKEQDGAVAKLIQLGFIKKIIKGVPAKRYFQVQEKAITAYFVHSKNLSNMSQKDKLERPKRTNQSVPKGQTYKEPKEEPKKETYIEEGEERASAPPPPDIKKLPKKPKEELLQREEEVFTTPTQHESLKKRLGSEEKVQECYQKLSQWKIAKSITDANDYLQITKWVIQAIEEKPGRKHENAQRSNTQESEHDISRFAGAPPSGNPEEDESKSLAGVLRSLGKS